MKQLVITFYWQTLHHSNFLICEYFTLQLFFATCNWSCWNVHSSTTVASHTSHRYCIVTSQDGTFDLLNVSKSKHITQIFEVDSRRLDPRSFQFTNTLVQLGWCGGYMLGWCEDDEDGDEMMTRHGQDWKMEMRMRWMIGVWERRYSARCQLDNMGTHTHT